MTEIILFTAIASASLLIIGELLTRHIKMLSKDYSDYLERGYHDEN